MVADFAEDVPSRIDLRTSKDAQEWAASAMLARPWRAHFFQQFVGEVGLLGQRDLRILELGSGPGFLAQRILATVPDIHYTMLDFSPAMHDLARERLGPLMQHVRPVVADFKGAGWSEGLGTFDAVLTNQAVHELRHKRHALRLHRSVRPLLTSHGRYLVCDHYVGADGMMNEALYMTVAEQQRCLEEAGFSVTMLRKLRGLVLHRGIAG